MTNSYPRADIQTHLRGDRVLRPLVDGIRLAPVSTDPDVYARLVRAILYQQLSGKAAATIHRRFLELFPSGYPAPAHLLELDAATLRTAGVSRQKAGYLHQLAHHFLQHDWQNRDWQQVDDTTLLADLTAIKGVGQWTVEMLLMFALGREDILPIGDLGVQNAMKSLYGIDGKGKALAQQMTAIAIAWSPYRTYACRYLWRYQDGALAQK